MKVASSSITFASQRNAVEKHEVNESLRMWVGNQRPDFERRERFAPAAQNVPTDVVTLSVEAKAAQPVKKKSTPAYKQVSPAESPKMLVVKLLIERLTGKKIKLASPDELQPDAQPVDVPDPKQAAQPPPRAGFGVEYDYHESHYESEKTTFTAEGVIKTADGKESDFTVNFGLSREFMEQHHISLRAGDAVLKDPLVINFNGTAAELTDTKFDFDVDADGATERISFVSPNSGFLALDRNEDGVINDGSELFGPSTGNGFAELAGYDADRNQWIDESDPVYQRLRVWSKDADGKDVLLALGQKGIGAIYLGHIATPFAVKDEQNELQGQLRASGVYLNENGTVGTIQQVDLAV